LGRRAPRAPRAGLCKMAAPACHGSGVTSPTDNPTLGQKTWPCKEAPTISWHNLQRL
jgi:hypothetical protein